MRLGWVNTLRRMRGYGEIAEPDLSAYLETAKRLGYGEDSGEQAAVLDLNGPALAGLTRFFAEFGITDRTKVIQAMFDAEIDSEAIVAALKGLPEYRAPFPSLPKKVP